MSLLRWRRRMGAGVAAVAVLVAVASPITIAHEGHDLGITVRIPLALSPDAAAGKKLYDEFCATCHGSNVDGTHKGPSLIPYDEVHHPDGHFLDAVKSGVEQHHWNFGPMKPVDGLSGEETRKIIAYVRELQAFNADPKNANPGDSPE